MNYLLQKIVGPSSETTINFLNCLEHCDNSNFLGHRFLLANQGNLLKEHHLPWIALFQELTPAGKIGEKIYQKIVIFDVKMSFVMILF
jgi:hypothetical protein